MFKSSLKVNHIYSIFKDNMPMIRTAPFHQMNSTSCIHILITSILGNFGILTSLLKYTSIGANSALLLNMEKTEKEKKSRTWLHNTFQPIVSLTCLPVAWSSVHLCSSFYSVEWIDFTKRKEKKEMKRFLLRPRIIGWRCFHLQYQLSLVAVNVPHLWHDFFNRLPGISFPSSADSQLVA